MQCFSSKIVLREHTKDCLMINGKQNVKLESRFIIFKNYYRQMPVSFKIYADFECILKSVDSDIINNDVSYTRKYQDHVPCSFAYKVVCVDNRFSKKLFCTKEQIPLINLLNQFLMSTIIVEE